MSHTIPTRGDMALALGSAIFIIVQPVCAQTPAENVRRCFAEAVRAENKLPDAPTLKAIQDRCAAEDRIWTCIARRLPGGAPSAGMIAMAREECEAKVAKGKRKATP